MWSIYTMEYYASIRKDEYPTFVATWSGLEEIMLSEISQAERESQSSYGFTYLWSVRSNVVDIGRWKGEVSWGKLEGETNHEKLWTLRNKLRVGGEGDRRLDEPGVGIREGTYCMEHWVWCINNEFWNTEKKLKINK